MHTTDQYTEPIQLGSIVDVLYLEKSFRTTLSIVAPKDANPFKGRMSVLSPLCRAILGRRRDDVIDLSAPGGRFRIRIEGVDNSAVDASGPAPADDP